MNPEFFAGKLFRRLNFRVVLSSSPGPLDEINFLYLLMEENISPVSFSSLKVVDVNFAIELKL